MGVYREAESEGSRMQTLALTAVSRRNKLETKEIWRSVEGYRMDVRKQEGITIIEKIATPSNLMAACEKVHKGKGAASIDGITVYEIDGHMATRQKAIIAILWDGTYKSQPVKWLSITKGNGSMCHDSWKGHGKLVKRECKRYNKGI